MSMMHVHFHACESGVAPPILISIDCLINKSHHGEQDSAVAWQYGIYYN